MNDARNPTDPAGREEPPSTFDREILAGLDESNSSEDRMADGTYGICCRCGGPISEARLRAVPEAPLCPACAEEALQPRRARVLE